MMLSTMPIIIVGARYYGRFVRKVSAQVQDALAASGDLASETIGAIRTVRSFSNDDEFVRR